MYDVVISLLVYNQPEVTRQCIESLFATARTNFLLVISDNASREETAAYLRSVAGGRPNVAYIRNDENLGFIGAHNKVYATYADNAEHFCVLNNDLVFGLKGWDSVLLAQLLADEKLAQVGPTQAHGCLNAAGVGVPRSNSRPNLDYIEGSCFIVKTAAVGPKLFESKYMKFAFCEDADLSLRLRAAGHRVKEIPGVMIQHKHHVTFKREKIDFDYKEQERANQRFLLDRWQKYFRTGTFAPLEILVIRTGALGDAFMAEPITRELANKYPGCRIYFQTKAPGWFTPGGAVVECGPDLKRARRYDITINLDMAYEKRPKIHVVDAYAEAATVTLDDDKRVPHYAGPVALVRQEKTAVICAEGSWASRQWPLESIAAFARYLQGRGYRVREVGRTPTLYTGVGENLIGALPLHDVVTAISEADLYFGMDGGLAHFAQSVGTPCLLIFGCTNPAYRLHDHTRTTAVWLGGLSCAGCHHEGGARTFTACRIGTHECLTGISVGHVIEQFEGALHE